VREREREREEGEESGREGKRTTKLTFKRAMTILVSSELTFMVPKVVHF